jgi:adenosylcobinamide-phosphate synthase
MLEVAGLWGPLWANDVSGSSIAVLALLVALLIDHCWGEPPVRWHPVVWMGHALAWASRRWAPTSASTGPDWRSFWRFALFWCLLAALVSAGFAGLQIATLHFSAQVGQTWLSVSLAGLCLGLWLKPLLSWRMLRSEVQAVEAALGQSLEAGRARLAWLVSRDVTTLDAVQVRESAIESLAENLSDSVIAPLFWFLLAGLPGAALYRLANTADAMWGYPGWHGHGHHARYWQWAGKWAARADDVLSWLPARLTALFLGLAAAGLPWRSLAQQARQTPSPNSGWPMAAMALALQIRLGKPGVYQLHPAGYLASARHSAQACSLAARAVALVCLLALLAGGWWALF